MDVGGQEQETGSRRSGPSCASRLLAQEGPDLRIIGQ